ncbi:uncharacterized protein A4U43_C03F19860 [Asparagus officinalis]|uniref:Uncharacterized protein n=1 Tax=Asparagus officinalis TaxID=4686 RepID=A0A5P1FCA5_ASPOF|nr:uncharacterized protein A4U43_C03F19860 [Asparagus officinalis]
MSAAGFLVDNAARFQALVVVIENISTLGYFSSTQAPADYAQLIIELEKNLSAENCPFIAMGGSYREMLASWFRLKYRHIVIGAHASSASILYFDIITPENGYPSVVTKDFQERGGASSCGAGGEVEAAVRRGMRGWSWGYWTVGHEKRGGRTEGAGGRVRAVLHGVRGGGGDESGLAGRWLEALRKERRRSGWRGVDVRRRKLTAES